MIGKLLQMWLESRRDKISRAIAGVFVVLWIVGSLPGAYESLTSQWTTPHCPQGASHQAQHSQNHCAWHCYGIDSQAATGRNQGCSADPAGDMVHVAILSQQTVAYREGPAPRGPPTSGSSERRSDGIQR